MKKKILFLIPNLKHGGAEKVLVNLVNNMDPVKYDITVQTLFDVGVYKGSLKPHVHYIPGMKHQFRGNNTLAKCFPAKFLWKRLVKEHSDIAISYLEGPTTRILAGRTDQTTKGIAWVHTTLRTPRAAAIAFRSVKEAEIAYNGFDRIITVSKDAQNCFEEAFRLTSPVSVLYNTNETEQIISLSRVKLDNDSQFAGNDFTICSAGKLTRVKGFDRLLDAHKRLLDEGLRHKVYILGIGEEQSALEQKIHQYGVEDSFVLLGFKDNPYQYMSRCDLYVCSSRREGFSTAVTEALVVGTPVVSTDCSGAKELLGEHDEYGIVVENSEEGLYEGMKRMLSDPELLAHYKAKAKERGSFFSREQTVRAVEDMLDSL